MWNSIWTIIIINRGEFVVVVIPGKILDKTIFSGVGGEVSFSDV